MIYKEANLFSIDKTLYPYDRARNLKHYVDVNGNEVPETYEILHFDRKVSDLLFRVSSADLNRLDAIAALPSIYNDENLWWIIAEANNIIDPFKVPIGTVLVIPAKQDLYRAGGVLA